MNIRRIASLAGTLLLAGALATPGTARAEEELSIQDFLKIQDDATRGASSEGTMKMRVKTARWDRALTIKMWSEGSEKTLMRIESPAKEKGTSTLKVDKDIWNYLPKVDRTIKVPASMMSGAWMGSHFTNDDLVQESRYSEDFKCQFLAKPQGGQGKYQIECIPNPDAAVVWGKVHIQARAEDKLADEIRFYDEKGKLVRSMVMTDFTQMGGRTLPRHMKLVPADKPDEFTEVSYEEMAFDVQLPARTFTLQALKR